MSGIIAAQNIIIILFIFLFGLFIPRLTRKEIILGVRIPQAFRDHDEVRRIKKSYTRNYMLIIGLPSIVIIVLQLMKIPPIIHVLSILVLCALFFVNYYFCHKSLREIKIANKWKEGYQETSVMDIGYKPGEALVSPWWFSIPLALILIQVILVLYKYDSLPDTLPLHYDASGNIDRWGNKSYRLMFMMPAMEILLTGVMFFIYKIIGWSKQQLSVEAPEDSKTRNRIFRRRWSAFMIILSVLLIIPTFSIHLFTLQILKIHFGILLFGIIILEPMLILLVAGWIAYTTGQSGSRIKLKEKPEQDKNKIDRDDDKYWKAGIIYYNPDDPAIFVEKRFGVGWTFNFGNKIALFLAFALIILIPVALFFISFMRRS